MAIAGRVAIVPKGEYSNAVTYDKLDLVMFNNDAYVAKKASTGIEPTNDEYWMLILNNVVAEDLEKIINGTTPVGNANNLGGKGASEYMEVAKYQPIATEILSTSIKERALTLGKGAYDFSLAGSYYTGNDLPNGYTYGSATVFVRSNTAITIILWGVSVGSPIALTYYNGTDWADWYFCATTADLANYLPLSGGKLNAPTNVPLELQSGSDNTCAIKYIGANGVALGFLGLGTEGQGLLYNKDGQAVGTLLHTGNRIELIGSASGVNNPIAFDTNVYKELYCELSYFGSAKVTFDIVIPNGGSFHSGLETGAGTLGGVVRIVNGNTIQVDSFCYEGVSRTDNNVALTVYGKR